MPGTSNGVLLRASDSRLYVTKFADDPVGTRILFNEWMGYALYMTYGLRVPRSRTLRISLEFLTRSQTSTIRYINQDRPPEPGDALASQVPGRLKANRCQLQSNAGLKRIRTRTDLWKTWLIDSFAEHAETARLYCYKIVLKGYSGISSMTVICLEALITMFRPLLPTNVVSEPPDFPFVNCETTPCHSERHWRRCPL